MNRNNKFENDYRLAEFDNFADNYYVDHKKNIEITGENPEFFSEYKIADVHSYINKLNLKSNDIFDFGCGIGNSIEYFRKYFKKSNLICGDVSVRSMDIAKSRFPGLESFVSIRDTIPLDSECVDIVFSACVFHHIDHEEHNKWLIELNRITRKGGVLVIYEHNPLNPLTVRAVNNCPFDKNARLIRAGAMNKNVTKCGWTDVNVEYKLFFPSILKNLRPVEKYLTKVFLGAQWRLIAKKS